MPERLLAAAIVLVAVIACRPSTAGDVGPSTPTNSESLRAGPSTPAIFESLRTSATGASAMTLNPHLTCTHVRGDMWSLMPGLEFTGRLALSLPANRDAEIVLIVGDDLPLALTAETTGGANLPLRQEPLRAAFDSTIPVDYWIDYGEPWKAPAVVRRVTLRALPDREQLITMRLGRRAPRVLARTSGYPEHVHPSICAAPLDAPSELGATARHVSILPTHADHFGTGWSGFAAGDASSPPSRAMGKHGAILVSSRIREAVRVSLEATASGSPNLLLTVNDVYSLPAVVMSPDLRRYEWEIPASAWLEGVNELLFRASWTDRGVGMSLKRFDLTGTREGLHLRRP